MPIWSRLFSGLFGVGVGIAAADAIEPVAEVAKQEAWYHNANKVLGPGELAALVAQGLAQQGEAQDQAQRQGFNADKFDHLAALAQRAPAAAEARVLRRRRLISPELLHHAYAKAQIEPRYWDQLDALLNEHLSPEVVALAIVRGLIPDPGILPVPPPVAEGKVPKFPVFDVDAVKESESEGIDLTRLSVLAGIAGRPMSPEAAAEAFYKGIIELADFERAVSESDVRNEWRDAILDNQRFRLRPADWAGLWLRGWVTEQEANAGGAQYGATPETMLRLYQNRGRPATPRQVHLGYARGAHLPGFEGDENGALDRAVKESDIRSEWVEIEKANRWSYPSPFVLRQLTNAGVFDADTTYQILLEMGWKPIYARPTADAWAAVPAASGSSWTPRAASQLWTATHRAYIRGDADEALARSNLELLGVAPADRDQVVALWDAELGILRRDLTQAQVLKLFRKGIWTRDQALTWLTDEGMLPGDAADLLDAQ